MSTSIFPPTAKKTAFRLRRPLTTWTLPISSGKTYVQDSECVYFVRPIFNDSSRLVQLCHNT
jgi:hypothetical protein